jgi:hypothetical protein
MLRLLSALAVALFVLAAAPSVQAAPAADLLSLKNSQSAVEPVYWRYHRHWHHYRYWRHPVYWGHRHYWRHPVYWRHRHYWRHPVYWHHHRHWRYYRRHFGWRW